MSKKPVIGINADFRSVGSDDGENQDILVTAKRFQDECEQRYSTHIAKAPGYINGHYWLGGPLVIATALAGISSVGSIAQSAAVPWLNGLVVASALVAAVLAPLQTFLNLSERGVKHQTAAAGYDALKNQIEIFFLRYPTAKDVIRQDAAEEMQKFADTLAELKRSSPLY